MQIQSIQNNRYTPNFGVKMDTSNVLEVTSLKMINGNGVNGMKDVFLKLNPSKDNGELQRVREEAIKDPALKRECKNIIDKIGNEVDITL